MSAMDSFEYRGAIHIHTVHSDGTGEVVDVIAAARDADLDFIIITDHNRLLAQEGEGWHNGVLTLLDAEIHDPELQPEGNHCLTLNVRQDYTPLASEPQGLMDAVTEAGGLTFLAHPYERASDLIPQIYPWRAWDIEGYTGLEIWNLMSEFRPYVTSKLRAILVAFFPQFYTSGPYPETLNKWDALLQERPTPAIGGPDAHAQVYTLGPIRRRFLSYDYCFRAVTMHILTPQPFSGEVDHDRTLVYQALSAGRSWVAYDMATSSKGFHFEAIGDHGRAQMGSSLSLGTGVRLEIGAPAAAELTIVQAGKGVVAKTRGRTLQVRVREPGAYRVEARKDWWLKSRGWIFSNPIYIT